MTEQVLLESLVNVGLKLFINVAPAASIRTKPVVLVAPIPVNVIVDDTKYLPVTGAVKIPVVVS